MFIENAWYVAAWADEVSEAPLARRLLDKPVVLFRDREGMVGALEDRCCHRAAPLSMGRVVEGGLECGYHGLTFNSSGACVSVPGQTKIPAKACVRSYPVVERQELIWIWMGDPEKADTSKIVDYPYHDNSADWPHKKTVYRIKANYMLVVDNLMDLTHVGYIHRSTIGGDPRTHVEAKMEVTPKENGLKFLRWMPDCVAPPTYAKAYPFGRNVDRWQEFEFIAPASIIQWAGAIETGHNAMQDRDQPGFSIRLFHHCTPESADSCFYFWSAANGYRQDDPSACTQLFEEIGKAFAEDKVMVEGQQSLLTELGTDRLVDIASDRARVHMRRVVDRLLDAEAVGVA